MSIGVSENITVVLLPVMASNVCNNTLHPSYNLNALCMVNHCLINSCVLSKPLLYSLELITGATTFIMLFYYFTVSRRVN